MSKKLLIETTAGNTIVDVDSLVGSYVSGKNVFVKPAKDVNIGEKVSFEKQFVYKTLQDIEKDLLDSPRYRAARNRLYVKNEAKEQTAISYILNNTLLLKGLNENEKINKLYEVMGKKVTKQTVKDWLSGETVMPEFENLGLILNVFPELDTIPSNDETEARLHIYRKMMLNDFYDGFKRKKEDGLAYPLYDLYMNIRRGIMRYVAEPKGKGDGEKKEHKKTAENVPLSPEIDIVVKKYFDDVSDKIISARVTGIKEIESKEALKLTGEKHEKLKKGVVKIKPENKREFLEKNGLNEVSLVDILNDFHSISYVSGKYVKNIVKEKFNKDIGEKVASFIFTEKIMKNLNPKYKPLVQIGLKIHSKENIEKFKEGLKNIQWLGGALENLISIDEHNIVESISSLQANIVQTFPDTYLSYAECFAEISDAYKSSIISGRLSIPKRDYDKKMNERKKIKKELQDVYGLKGENISKVKAFASDFENDELTPITDEDGKNVLIKYGMEELIPKIFG